MNSNKTFIIAEVGVNHNNDINISKKIINFCSKQKIDAVKFQTFKAEKLALKKLLWRTVWHNTNVCSITTRI